MHLGIFISAESNFLPARIFGSLLSALAKEWRPLTPPAPSSISGGVCSARARRNHEWKPRLCFSLSLSLLLPLVYIYTWERPYTRARSRRRRVFSSSSSSAADLGSPFWRLFSRALSALPTQSRTRLFSFTAYFNKALGWAAYTCLHYVNSLCISFEVYGYSI